jgi:serine/threonine protein kinase
MSKVSRRSSITKTLEVPTHRITFAGRYEIIGELGAGGRGRVFRALDNKLNEEVALKLIKPELSADKRAVGAPVALYERPKEKEERRREDSTQLSSWNIQ